MGFPGNLFEQFQGALLWAFRDVGELAQMVRIKLEENLATIASSENLSEATFDLIDRFERRGKLDSLLKAAREYIPENPDLKQFEQAFNQWAAEAGKLSPLSSMPQLAKTHPPRKPSQRLMLRLPMNLIAQKIPLRLRIQGQI